MKRIILLIALLFSCTIVPAHAAQQALGLNDVIAAIETFNKVEKANGKTTLTTISDFTADFVQRTLLKKEGRELRGDGTVSVKLATANSTSLMFNFQYYRPYPQQIVSDGNSLWIYHPENREVILSDVSSAYNRPGYNPDRDSAVNFLQGLRRISKDFHINYASGMYDSAGNYVLELTPRRAMINTRRILLVVNRNCVISSAERSSATTASSPLQSRTSPTAQRTPFATPAPFAGMPAFGGTSDPFPLLSSTVEDQDGNSTTMEFANIKVNSRLSNTDFTFMIPPGVQTVRPSERNQPR